MSEIVEREIELRNLRLLAEEHKKHCKGASCDISLILVGRLYGKIANRKLTQQEWKVFT